MPLSSEEAARVLRNAEEVSALSGTLYGYRRAAPHLVLWGAIWLFGFGMANFFHDHINLIWSVLDTIGIAGSMYLARLWGHSSDHAMPERSERTWRWLASVMIVIAFFVLVQIIMAPTAERQSTALMGLIVAAAYAFRGLWGSPRIGVMGVLLAAVTLFGYFFIASYYNLWMAVFGGGSLIVAGLWLRTA
ncbi:glucan phosphoethanolaminetransferase (alkaline phosphatase superfamily) [Paraburkholderia sp. GAS41]|uniref:hypothetical protein n=1 Tax=Paraburkholderia sp. GAS41 TaxID=3035134 RepID=UPI003D1CAA6C